MADHILQTHILLRYDNYNNWMNSNVILKPGEAAVASITNARTIEESNSTPEHTPPAIGIKVGDGIHYFRELPWVQAIAGDVYAWAKSATKPSYTASEIINLQQFVEQYSTGTGGGDGTVTPRLYQLVEGTGNDANKYYLQYKTAEDPNWVTDTTQAIDLSVFVKIANWIGNDVDRFLTLGNRTAEHIQYMLSALDYNDSPVAGEVVVAVNETDGKIAVTRSSLGLNSLTGILDVLHGGTGVNSLPDGQVLIGHGTNPVTGIELAMEVASDNKLVPNYAIKAYVDEKTAGLTGAMHYVGEATVEINPEVNNAVNPRIEGYDFSKALPGDVITAGRQELVWTGSGWRLLGDEGSYAVKGSIKDADIDPDAAIQQSKIANLTTDLYNKVDKVTGKQLSTNDYTNEEKNKLNGIEAGAQRNLIEHILLNSVEQVPTIIENKPNSINLSIKEFPDTYKTKVDSMETGAQANRIEHIFLNSSELPIATVNGLVKSVNINLIEFTQAEKTKLEGIATGAQVNTIERFFLNEVEQFPTNKELHLTVDQAVLKLSVLEGARVPGTTAGTYEDVIVSEIGNTKKLELARIAKTGDVKDLLQSADEYVTIYCGTSTEII